jgi:DNA-binding transcriptional LysR family regulator
MTSRAVQRPAAQGRLTVDDLARYPRVGMLGLQAEIMHIEHQLTDLGVTVLANLRVPYFAAAMTALAGTQLFTIVPRRFAQLYTDDTIQILETPEEVKPLAFGMAWDPRQNSDPAHTWLRELIDEVAQER